jgi:hypothetical protein
VYTGKKIQPHVCKPLIAGAFASKTCIWIVSGFYSQQTSVTGLCHLLTYDTQQTFAAMKYILSVSGQETALSEAPFNHDELT